LELICATAHADTGDLVDSATWLLFLCHIHGYGVSRDPQKAITILESSPNNGPESHRLFSMLCPVISDAFGLEELNEDESITNMTNNFRNLLSNKRGPWMKANRERLAIDPVEHGIRADQAWAITQLPKEISNSILARATFSGGNSALHVAAIFGLSTDARYLVERHECNINAVNDRNETPLFLACVSGNADIVEYLLGHAADASIETKTSQSCLHWLCQFEHQSQAADIALKLVKNGASIDFNKPSKIKTHRPSINVTLARKFLNSGSIGRGPILQAVADRDMASLGILLGIGEGWLNFVRPENRIFALIEGLVAQPLRLACELLLPDIVKMICCYARDLIIELPKEGIVEKLRPFIEAIKDDPSALGPIYQAITDSTGPLSAVLEMDLLVLRLCYHGREWKSVFKSVIGLLALFGFVQPFVKTKFGLITTLSYTVRCGNDDALEIFLETEAFGKQIDYADPQGYTLVHHALESRQFGALTTLAKHGASLDLRKKKDPNHVLSGVEASYLHVIGSLRIDDPAYTNLFLDRGVPATICDNRGISALNLALKRGAFTVARILIDRGEDITSHGVYGLTLLGELFRPGAADQHDDLFSTFKFLLSCESHSGTSLFITNHDVGYSVLHTAASYYSVGELYIKLVSTVLQHYGKSEHIEAKANNPGKSTALQTAVAMHNPVAVKALVEAGACTSDKDMSGQTPLDLARENVHRLFHAREGITAEEKEEKLDRATSVMLILAEKASWPGSLIRFPMVFDAIDSVQEDLRNMQLSIHMVSYMSELKTSVLETINTAMTGNLPNLKLEEREVCRRVIHRRVKPALRSCIEYHIFPSADTLTDGPTQDTLNKVREKIPWTTTLTDTRFREFQQAAIFEWLLDIMQSNNTARLPGIGIEKEAFSKFIQHPVRQNLPIDPLIVQFPQTLLDWYLTEISKNPFLQSDQGAVEVEEFLAVLQQREKVRAGGVFPLPELDEKFREFHFDMLQSTKLDATTACDAIILLTRCRCSHDKIGIFSSFHMMRLCQKMSSIDEDIWQERLKFMRDSKRRNTELSTKWKAELGIEVTNTGSTSIMRNIWFREVSVDFPSAKETKTYSLLTHPSLVELAPQIPVDRNTVPLPTPPKVGLVTHFDYEPLDFTKNEIRLLTLVPPKESEDNMKDLVECRIGHFSLNSWTEDFDAYLKSLDLEKIAPEEFYAGWHKLSTSNDQSTGHNTQRTARFIWGDFSCLSYTWGDASEIAKIILNGAEVMIGANLEAALRVLRKQENFRSGTMLWADALCINQSSLAEKEVVVRDMTSIYFMADTVTVWLGRGDEMTMQYTDTIRNFAAKYDRPFSRLQADELNIPPLWYATKVYPAIRQIVDRPYWRRLWIMQELVAAPCEYLYLGDNKVSWRDLGIAISYEALRSSRIVEITDEFTEVESNRVQEIVSHACSLISFSWLYQTLPGLGKSNMSLELGDWSSWCYLGTSAQVTDEKDRVYGLLSLLPEAISSRVEPNYSKSVEEVFCDLSRAILEATGSFDEILCGTLLQTPDLPTWAMNLREKTEGTIDNAKAAGYLKPRSSFSKTATWMTYWSYDCPPEWLPQIAFSEDGKTLMTKAIHVATVEGTFGGAIALTEPVAVMDMPRVEPSTPLRLSEGGDERETLLRILNRDPEFADASRQTLLDIPWYSTFEPLPTMIEALESNGWYALLQLEEYRVFHYFRRSQADVPLWNGKRFKDYFASEVGPCDEAAIKHALRRSKSIAQRAFITTEKGNLGVTRLLAREGDHVVVVPGCSYPVLVRKMAGSEVFTVVGECYLDGYMNGEAVKLVEDGTLGFIEIQLQ
jgi:ankyrin repeat protein